MKLQKSDTNNAIVTVLANVRKHPNADRLKLATVLGTQVVVGLDAKDGDVVIYFDSNLRLSHEYLHHNNLYSNKELNTDSTQKGYFGKHGRVRAQKFRGETSNGYVAEMGSLIFPGTIQHYDELDLQEGDEFTHINGVKICEKYFVESKSSGRSLGTSRKRKSRISTDMFWKHWDTKQLMRESERIVSGTLFVEEKIHGTSGRTAHALYHKRRRWYQLWKPKCTSFWKVISGTRHRDGIGGHMKTERRIIHEKLASHIHKGEELYYEIYGYELNGKVVQKGYSYGCVPYSPKTMNDPNNPCPYKVMLYRVTITTEDGYRIDLDRDQVYQRAEELGLEKPYLLDKFLETEHTKWDDLAEITQNRSSMIIELAKGRSALDAGTLREGIVVWFKDETGCWTCLKHKSEEFLIGESKQKDDGIGDVEDDL